MLGHGQLIAIRARLGLSQEAMARLLNVSFASVNRWEGGHSSPTGSIQDLYLALDAALRGGHTSDSIRRAANNERGVFLYFLFRMAYGPTRQRAAK
jgi:transcriptional regulator with XRE-family HTH domain